MNKHIKLKKKYPPEKWMSEHIRYFTKHPEEAENLWVVDGKVNLKNELRAHSLLGRKIYKDQWLNARRLNLRDAELELFLNKLPITRRAHKNKDGEWACDRCGCIDTPVVAQGSGRGYFEHICECKNCGATIVFYCGYGENGRRR